MTLNLLPYKFFIYINYVLTAAIVALPWVFLPDNTPAKVVLTVIGVILFAIQASSKKVSFPAAELISPRFVVLATMAVAVIIPFLHFILKYTENVSLLWAMYIVCILQLITIIIADLTKLD
jgi:hypothetical protein